MNNSKREMIEMLVDLLDESELSSIIENVIEAKSSQLSRLQELSSRLAGTSNQSPQSMPFNQDIPEDIEGDTAGQAVLRILKAATRPIGNSEIRKRYSELYGKEISGSGVGNALWKGKNKNLYRKVGSRAGARYTKWKYVGDESQ